MQNELSRIQKNAKGEIGSAQNLDRLEELRIQFLGRKGALTSILRGLKDLPENERREIGARANKLQREIGEWISEKRKKLQSREHETTLEREWLDITRPGLRQPKGHLHPITLITREAIKIFGELGFSAVEGPEIETEYYNFDALNIPKNHPARDMWDTFWLHQKEISNYKLQITKKSKILNSKSQKLLLRTHTSPMQVRYMEKHNPPLRIVVPGRVYRYEATDASHDIQFYQLEGLLVDKQVSIAHFKTVMQEFFSRFFKKGVSIRLRPSYFPFTEPSFEVDISCITCDQKGCSVCKQGGWLELAGAGLVHPNVFKSAGYARGEWQGFAFGMGLDRLAMMKYRIPDIRLFHSGDLRFLKQF